MAAASQSVVTVTSFLRCSGAKLIRPSGPEFASHVSLHYAQLAWKWETHALAAERYLADGGPKSSHEIVHAFLHDLLRGAGARRDGDRLLLVEPLGPQLVCSVHQIGGLAAGLADLHQAPAVGAVLASQDDQHICLRNEAGHGLLPIRRGIADVFLGGRGDVGIATLQAFDQNARLVKAERRLGE